MITTSYASRIGWWLLRFIQLQLFITLFSLPILILWGLPFSLLSPLGNLIFGPALTAFLFISSLAFFTELIGIPNSCIMYLLEHITNWWLTLMPADPQRWLVGFAKPPAFLCFALIVSAVGIMLIRKTAAIKMSIIFFSALFICFYGYTSRLTPKETFITLPCNRGSVSIFMLNNELYVVDPGYIGQRLSAASWAQYTLIPHIIKETGRTTIDHLIFLQPSGLTFEAAERICAKTKVRNLYMPYWQGEMTRSSLRKYGTYKKSMQEHGTTCIRIGHKPIALNKATNPITITYLHKEIYYQDISFPALALNTQIDNQNVTIYSAKYIIKKPHEYA